jgi:hypothetical protein
MKASAKMLASNEAYRQRELASNPRWDAERKAATRRRHFLTYQAELKRNRKWARVRRAKLKGLILWAMIWKLGVGQNGQPY